MLNPFNLIIPAAGSARRMQSAEPKQFMLINNKTVLEHAINAFLPFKPNQIVVAVHVDYMYVRILYVLGRDILYVYRLHAKVNVICDHEVC